MTTYDKRMLPFTQVSHNKFTAFASAPPPSLEYAGRVLWDHLSNATAVGIENESTGIKECAEVDQCR